MDLTFGGDININAIQVVTSPVCSLENPFPAFKLYMSQWLGLEITDFLNVGHLGNLLSYF